MRIPSGKVDQVIYFVAVDVTDLRTRETGLTGFTVYRSRNGGAATAYTTPTVTELSAANMPGVYALTVDEDTTIAAGSDSEEYVVHITQASMAPVTRTIELYRRDTTSGQTLTVTSGGVTLADGVSHGGTLGSSTATLALSRQSIVSQSSNTSALTVTGNGSGHGAVYTGGATGDGVRQVGGATSGHGSVSTATGNGDGAQFTGVGTSRRGATYQAGTNADGVRYIGAGTGSGTYSVGGATGHGSRHVGGATSGSGFTALAQTDGDGMELTGAGAGVDLDADMTGNITGNLSGSVGSVTGNVGGNVTGSVGSVAAGGITAASIATDAIDADALAASAVTEIQSGLSTLNAAAVSAAVWDAATASYGAAGSYGLLVETNLDAAVSSRLSTAGYTAPDNASIAAILVDTGTTLQGELDGIQATVDAILLDTAEIGAAGAGLTNINLPDQTMNITGNITGNLSGSVGSVTGLTNATIADQVWDEALAGHLTAGSTGEALNAAGAAGDPWATALPGAYGAGTAGKIIGDNINAPIGTVDTVVDAIKAKTDSLTFSVAGQVDSNVQYVNDVQVTGDGQPGTEWGPV